MKDQEHNDPAGMPEGQRNGLASGLKRKLKHLRPWAHQHGIECYRIFDCEDADLPLQIDIYGKFLHVCELARDDFGSSVYGPHWLESAASVAGATLGIRIERVFTKYRPKRGWGEQHEKQDDKGHTEWVTEAGLHFKVNFSDYMDTGLFLDHRITRGMVADICEGARVLNLFCYTGSFTVYAAAGSAIETTSVDLSGHYLQWAQENLEANDLHIVGSHNFVHEDVFAFLNHAKSAGRKWDVIVLDPPTFSNSRTMDRTMDIRRDHPEMILTCLDLLSPNGILVFSTNAAGFYLNKRRLGRLKPTNLTNETTPEDFAKSRPHSTWLFNRAL